MRGARRTWSVRGSAAQARQSAYGGQMGLFQQPVRLSCRGYLLPSFILVASLQPPSSRARAGGKGRGCSRQRRPVCILGLEVA